MKPLVISFSGGRTSAYMTKILLDNNKEGRKIVVVFANTGREREETLQFVRDCDRHYNFNTVWVESTQFHGQRKSAGHKVVTFETASRKGQPFEDMIIKHGIPNAVFPHCSRELKANPIKSYLKSQGINKYDMALGIRVDEPKRLTNKKNVVYPLHREYPTTKLMVNQWWFKNDFNLQLKDYEGNCDLCWKKSNRKLLTLLVENPSFANWWNEMEIKYGTHIPPSQINHRVTPITFFRGNTSIAELIEDTKIEFVMQTDAFTEGQLQTDAQLDSEESGCGSGSCEPF